MLEIPQVARNMSDHMATTVSIRGGNHDRIDPRSQRSVRRYGFFFF